MDLIVAKSSADPPEPKPKRLKIDLEKIPDEQNCIRVEVSKSGSGRISRGSKQSLTSKSSEFTSNNTFHPAEYQPKALDYIN